MSKAEITKFNHIVGNPPVGVDGDAEAIWEQLELQAKLVLEEAKEMYDAVFARDIVEFLDGSEDVYFLREYCDDLLQALGVDYKGARYEVNRNNSSKYTTSKELAQLTVLDYSAKGEFAILEETEYNGETFFVVKNEYGKVKKLINHVRPDLEKCVPQNLKEKLNERD